MNFLYLLVKPRLWSRKKYLLTQPIQSFPNPTARDNLTPASAHVKEGVRLYPKIYGPGNFD